MNAVQWRWVETELIWASHRHWPQGQWKHYKPISTSVIWLMLEGHLQIEMAGQLFELKAGDVCYQPSQIMRALHARETSVWQSVALRVVSPIHDNSLFDTPAVWRPQQAEMELMYQIGRELEAHQFSTSTANRLRVDGAIRWLLGCCLERIQLIQEVTRSDYPIWLQTALTSIEQQPQIDLGDLSEAVGYSPTQFRVRFRQLVGTSPREFAQECLGRKARQYLVGTDWSIEHIASELGFSAPTHFARFFKRRFGISPAQFRLRAS